MNEGFEDIEKLMWDLAGFSKIVNFGDVYILKTKFSENKLVSIAEKINDYIIDNNLSYKFYTSGTVNNVLWWTTETGKFEFSLSFFKEENLIALTGYIK